MRAGGWTNGADQALITLQGLKRFHDRAGGSTEMTGKPSVVTDASDTFWHAIKRAVELDDLAGFREAVRQIRQVSPAAAIAIADVIEAEEEPENAPPIVRWLIAALRGEAIPLLH